MNPTFSIRIAIPWLGMGILGDIIESIAVVVETINGTLPAPGEQQDLPEGVHDDRAPEAMNWDADEQPVAVYPE